jgi:hypothetical protein
MSRFFKITKVVQIFTTVKVMYAIILTKNGLG